MDEIDRLVDCRLHHALRVRGFLLQLVLNNEKQRTVSSFPLPNRLCRNPRSWFESLTTMEAANGTSMTWPFAVSLSKGSGWIVTESLTREDRRNLAFVMLTTRKHPYVWTVYKDEIVRLA
jgi:hypothetical protein